MVDGVPGLDVSSLVRGGTDREPVTRRESSRRARSDAAHRLTEDHDGVRCGRSSGPRLCTLQIYERLFATETGQRAVNVVGNESKTLDALSALSIEVLLEYLDERWGSLRFQFLWTPLLERTRRADRRAHAFGSRSLSLPTSRRADELPTRST